MPIERLRNWIMRQRAILANTWNQVITIRYSIDDAVKGTVMEFSGQGCKHLARWLKHEKQIGNSFS